MSVTAPASTAEGMDMVLTGLRHLAAADPTTLAAQAQAECLQAFEQADAIATAARAWFLGAFTAGQGYTEDADYESMARIICAWSDRLPAGCRQCSCVMGKFRNTNRTESG
jgi:hypothetical protein